MTTHAGHRSVRQLPIYNPGRPLIGVIEGIEAEPLTFHLAPYRRFGSLYRVRFGVRLMVVMAGREANEFIWQNTDLWDYPQRMAIFREGFDEHCILQLDGETHQTKKRQIVQGFKPSSFLPHRAAMAGLIHDRIQALPDGRHPDLRMICKRFTGIMTCYAMLQMLPPGDIDEKLAVLSDELLAGQSMGVLRHLWFLRKPYRRLQRELDQLADVIIEQRRANPLDKDDIFSVYLKSQAADGAPIDDAEAKNDLLFLLQAGTQTASQLITWGLMYLSEDKVWREELLHELSQWTPEQFTNLQQWPKLMATTLELERLRPSIPYFVMLPKQDFVYQGVQIPRTAHILHPLTLPHFMSEIYDDPESFQPQRFLGEQRYPQRPTHGTFGGGRHACPGQSLARTKVALALATILTQYDVRFEGPLSFRPWLAATITPEKAVPARFVPRTPG